MGQTTLGVYTYSINVDTIDCSLFHGEIHTKTCTINQIFLYNGALFVNILLNFCSDNLFMTQDVTKLSFLS